MQKKDFSYTQPPTQGFDTLVTHRDKRTGLVERQNPYTLRIVAEGTDKVHLFERPVGSGNLWNKAGEPMGRWVKNAWDKTAEHIEWTAPETQDEKLAREYAEKDVKIRELEKELAAVRTETGKKTQTQAQPAKKEQGA